MKTLTLDEYLAIFKAQGVPQIQLAMKCPMCGTIQNAQDLINAGAGKSFDDVEKYLGFSCVGRWTHGKSPSETKGQQIGCNWTLGGLFHMHTLEVVTPDGQKHPQFEPCTPEETKDLLARQSTSTPAGAVAP